MLDRPPGGAMIFWAVRLAMWSSACEPVGKAGSGRGAGPHPGASAPERPGSRGPPPTHTAYPGRPPNGHGGWNR